jgi:hypothetical protein
LQRALFIPIVPEQDLNPALEVAKTDGRLAKEEISARW